MSFLDVLAKQNVISAEDIPYISDEATTTGQSVEDILRAKQISNTAIVKAKGEYLKIPTRELDGKDIAFDVLKYIPEESANHYKIIPLGISDGVLEVGIVDPENIEARDALNFISNKTNMPFKIFLISEDDFTQALAAYNGIAGEVNKALGDLETEFSAEEVEMMKDRGDLGKAPAVGGAPNIIEDAPVTKIVATILRYAIEGGVSDVHIEPMKDRVRVRFRVDGVLYTSIVLPAKVHDALVARIKILSNIKLDEKRKPQDNRFSARIDGRKIDFRVSTFPTYYGEKVEMRILDQQKSVQKLDELGFPERNLKLIKEALDKPYGLILISGPTGSGKTTTLYSMVKELDLEENNVLSLEDPVEYNIEGLSQSQVRPEIGYTFATGLRTTLRQDPDIIMVGEIRDKETAELAIQAALTGHLVLSTIHTNSAVGIIPRLVDMGIDPYLIAPTLILGMAQRLVGKSYESAVTTIPVEGSIKTIFDKFLEEIPTEFRGVIPEMKDVYKISPTPDCPRGTKGRIAVTEMFEVDKTMQEIILKEPTEIAITKYARTQGMILMKEDATIKALNKVIPMEEISKV
ncbi:MAG: GspE/PulE family protein [bacterium]